MPITNRIWSDEQKQFAKIKIRNMFYLLNGFILVRKLDTVSFSFGFYSSSSQSNCSEVFE